MIKVLFFAQTRELIGQESITVESMFKTVNELRLHLAEFSDKWALALESDRLLAAINQNIVSLESALTDGDEVAFFPPVTGG